MPANSGPNAAEWFNLASRFFVEKHQGCPWCHGHHCLFRSRKPERVEFTCTDCEFFACHNHVTGCYYITPGQNALVAPEIGS